MNELKSLTTFFKTAVYPRTDLSAAPESPMQLSKGLFGLNSLENEQIFSLQMILIGKVGRCVLYPMVYTLFRILPTRKNISFLKKKCVS